MSSRDVLISYDVTSHRVSSLETLTLSFPPTFASHKCLHFIIEETTAYCGDWITLSTATAWNTTETGAQVYTTRLQSDSERWSTYWTWSWRKKRWLKLIKDLRKLQSNQRLTLMFWSRCWFGARVGRMKILVVKAGKITMEGPQQQLSLEGACLSFLSLLETIA